MYLARERVTKNEKCKFLLIKDTSQNSGRNFMQAMAVLYSKENVNVNYLSYDMPCNSILKKFCLDDHNFKVHDAFSDPFNWHHNEACPDFMSPDILHRFSDVDNTAVFIDSLYNLLFENSAHVLYKSIHELINCTANNIQLVTLLHADCHPAPDVSIIESIATTIVELLSTDEDHSCIRATARHSSGKVTQEILECKIDESGKIVMMKSIPPTKLHHYPQKRPDPTANLTFNLKLKDDEKESREKLQLPYAKVQSEYTFLSGDEILEDDFYEEEDPDDDLDV